MVSGTLKRNVYYLLFTIAFFCQPSSTYGQFFSNDSTVHLESRSLIFPPDLDSAKVDSFFLSRNIDLRTCVTPPLYFEIYRWYRTCYRYGGNSSGGIDCSHFINMLYEKIYGKTLQSSSAAIYTQCKPLKSIHKAKEGDLLFFRIHKKRISHIGIYLGDGRFAHASTKLGVIISHLDEEYYKKRFYKAGRLD